MGELPRTTTRASRTQIRNALAAAHRAVFGFDAPPWRLAHAWAQVMLENAHGQAVIQNNLGNLAGKHNGNFYAIRDLPPPDPPKMKFRAYPNLAAGAAGYWRLFRPGAKFNPVLEHWDRGDTCSAARLLGPGAHVKKQGPLSGDGLPEGLTYHTENRLGKICHWLYHDRVHQLVRGRYQDMFGQLPKPRRGRQPGLEPSSDRIGGGVLAALAGLATWLLLRRRKG